MSLPFTELLKIALVVAGTCGIHTCFTAPHPPPAVTEKRDSSSLEPVLSALWVPNVAKAVSWLIAFGDVSLILSSLGSPSSHVTASSQRNSALTTPFVLGTLLAFAGGFIRWLCYQALGRHFTFQMSIRKSHKLVTDGPYAVVRHPGYTGYFLTVFGTIFWYGSQGSWIRTQLEAYSFLGVMSLFVISSITTSVVSGLLTRLPVEDATLQQHFGKEWEEWADRVRWKLIPGIY